MPTVDAPLTPGARPTAERVGEGDEKPTAHHLPSPLHMRTPLRAACRSAFTTPHSKDASPIAHPDFELYEAKSKLEHELRERKERLRKLQLVKTYRTVCSLLGDIRPTIAPAEKRFVASAGADRQMDDGGPGDSHGAPRQGSACRHNARQLTARTSRCPTNSH